MLPGKIGVNYMEASCVDFPDWMRRILVVGGDVGVRYCNICRKGYE